MFDDGARLTALRHELHRLASDDRERWLDELLGLGALPDDGPELPAGCTPYLPCSVATVMTAVARMGIGAHDVVVDVGSGLGRAMTLVHLLTGAGVVGLEVQTHLVAEARAIAARVGLERVRTVHGDAERSIGLMSSATAFFFYCPFSGARLARVVDELRALAVVRPLRLCFVDMPAPDAPWIVVDEPVDAGAAITVATTRLHTPLAARAAAFNARSLASRAGRRVA